MRAETLYHTRVRVDVWEPKYSPLTEAKWEEKIEITRDSHYTLWRPSVPLSKQEYHHRPESQIPKYKEQYTRYVSTDEMHAETERGIWWASWHLIHLRPWYAWVLMPWDFLAILVRGYFFVRGLYQRGPVALVVGRERWGDHPAIIVDVQKHHTLMVAFSHYEKNETRLPCLDTRVVFLPNSPKYLSEKKIAQQPWRRHQAWVRGLVGG